MDLSKIRIETERLVLVSLSEKYAKQIFEEYEPISLFMNYPPPESVDILIERMRARQKSIREGKALFVAVLLKNSEEFLGCFSLDELDQPNPEMGGWLKKSAHGMRYGQEVAQAIKLWADCYLKYENIIWPCVELNSASRKLAEALGGKVEKTYDKKTAQGRVYKYVEYWLPRKSIDFAKN